MHTGDFSADSRQIIASDTAIRRSFAIERMLGVHLIVDVNHYHCRTTISAHQVVRVHRLGFEHPYQTAAQFICRHTRQ